MNVISFLSNRHWLNKDSISKPESSSKNIPKWYRDANRFAIDENGKYYEMDSGGKIPTWKACPALLDVFMSGYVLKTPCDINFYKDNNNEIQIKIKDSKYEDFCIKRDPLNEFRSPIGYYRNSFAWVGDWGLETPKGYSTLYMTPANRFDLPFINTTGIIDTDEIGLPGSLPFFLIEGWEGTIPAGTPYAQILPFKRENWSSELKIEKAGIIYDRIKTTYNKFRIPNGGFYKDNLWHRKEYL
jgi:hypothetical protein